MATTKKLNLPFLAKLFGGTFAFLVTVFFVHGCQVDKNSDALLRRAQTARDGGELNESARLRMRYLSHRPQDGKQYVETAYDLKGALMDKVKKREKYGREDVGLAMRYMEEAIQRNGSKPKDPQELEAWKKMKAKLRREAADLYFTGRDFLRTVDNLEALENLVGKENFTEEDRMKYINSLRALGGPNEEKAIAELEETLGYENATGEFDLGKAKHPEIVDAYQSLALLLFQSRFDREGAVKVLNQMCEVNKDNAKAFLNRSALIRHMFKDNGLTQVHKDIKRAYDLDPNDIAVLTATSQMLRELKQPEQAMQVIEKALSESNDAEVSNLLARKARLYLMLFEIQMTLRDSEGKVDTVAAAKILDRANKEVPLDRELLWSKARILLDDKEHTKVQEMYPLLVKAGVQKTVIDYLRARILLDNGETDKAMRALSRIRPALPPRVQLEADIYLIDGYGKLRQYDQQLTVIRELRKRDPSNQRVNDSYLSTLLILGRNEEANAFIQEQEQKQNPQDSDAEVPLSYIMAKLRLVMKNINPNSSEQELKKVQDGIRLVLKNPDVSALQKQTLMIDYFTKLDNPVKAKQAIRKAIADAPNVFVLWPMLLDQAQGKDEAIGILNEMKAKYGQRPEYDATIRTMQAKIAAKHSPDTALDVLKSLEQNLGSYTDEQKGSLFYELAKVHQILSNNTDAERLMSESLKLLPKNQRPILNTMLDTAVAAGDAEKIQSLVKTFRDTFGTDDESYRMAEARRIIFMASQNKITNKKAELAKARELVETVRAQRSEWAPAILVASDIERLDGNISGAIELLKAAYELQPTNGKVIRMIADFHRRNGQMDQAAQWMAKLPYGQRSSRDDQVELAGLLQRKDNWSKADGLKALKLLEAVMPESSEAYESHIIRSEVFLAVKQFGKAEKAALRAVDLDRANGQPWVSLVNVYAEQNQREKAESVIQQADSHLTEAEKPIVKGRCYALLKDYQQAQQFLAAALKNDPENIGIKRMLSQTLLGGNNIKLAAQVANDMIQKGDPEKDLSNIIWARRTLARIYNQSKSYEGFDKALALIDQNKINGQTDPGDLALYAMFCHGRSEKSSWNRGINRINEVAATRALSDSENFMKAQLMEKFGDLYWSDVKRIATTVAANRSGDVSVVDPLVKWLLKRDEISEAERWAENNLAGNSVTRMRVRLYAAAQQGKVADAIKEIEKRAPTPEQLDKLPKKLSDLLTYAAISEELGKFDKRFYGLAEKLMKRLVAKRPTEILRLAALVGIHGEGEKIRGGIQLCMTAKQQNVPDPIAAGVALGILREHPDKWDGLLAPSIKQLDSWFEKAAVANPDDIMLQWRMADFHDMIGNLDRVETLYKGILKSPGFENPNDRGMVMNNLAYAMALNGKSDEPMAHVVEAEKLLGDNPDLLDTRGFIHYVGADYAAAIRDFQSALKNGPRSGHKLFHLTLALDKQKNQTAAQEIWQEALKVGLTKYQLPPALHGEFDRLTKELGSSSLVRN